MKPGSYSFALALLVAAACNSADLTPSSAPGGPAAPDADPSQDDDPDALPDGGSPPLEEAGAAKTVGVTMSKAVSIQVQPTDKGDALLALVKGAQTSVHMTMYLLTDNRFIDALGDLHDAGKDVQVTLNQTFPPNGGDNQPAFTALTKRHVDVTWASSTYTYTHAKTIVIDGSKAVIMTMNLTDSSPTTNREYIATDSDADDVATLEKIFTADHGGKAVSYASKLTISPETGNASGSPRDLLVSFIKSAKTSVDMEIQTLDDFAIVDAIIAQQKAGLKMQIIVDGDVDTSNAETTVIAKLKSNGVALHTLHTPDLHAKAVVVDGAQVWVGSQNFTQTALDSNREVGVFTDVPSEVAKVKDQIGADYALNELL